MNIYKTLALIAASLPLLATAQDTLESRPVQLRLGFETVELPGRERMGMVGGTYFFQIAPNWYFGPAAYGAATGQRGGFFTGGADLAWKTQVMSNATLSTGVYVGGGGGGSAAVGGGLMLRPYVELGWKLEGYSLGISASQVRFPNGDIKSNQMGLVLSFDDRFVYAPVSRAGEHVTGARRGGVGFDRMSLVAGQYRPSAGSRDVSGQPYAESIGYAGFRADQMLSDHLYWGLESGAAVQGGADGYAEILGVAGAEYPLLGDRVRVGARVAAGLGGGGKVSTQGGTILKAALTARARLSDHMSLGLELGRVSAPSGAFKARIATLQVGMELDDVRPGAGERVLQGMEWEGKFTRYTSAARYSIPEQAFDTVGFAINRRFNSSLYATGQALSAVDGRAGGYSMGLVGLGLSNVLTAGGLSFGAEALLGAAGGGGVDTQGGAVAQASVYVSQALPGGARIKLGLGRVHSFKGALDSPLVDLSINFPFSVPAKP